MNEEIDETDEAGEMILCVPGSWATRSDFLQAVLTETGGAFMFMGAVLGQIGADDFVHLELEERDERMAQAFEYAGQGNISEETLAAIGKHGHVAYLHFPLDITEQRSRILKFTEVLSRCGGIAVKVENSGTAHEWERWFSLLDSDNVFDNYCACVLLIGDDEHYYSCGMHGFGLPDAQVPGDMDASEAAELLNQFNHYEITQQPDFASGNTFSLTADGDVFRLDLVPDERNADDDLFHNPYGLWNLSRV